MECENCRHEPTEPLGIEKVWLGGFPFSVEEIEEVTIFGEGGYSGSSHDIQLRIEIDQKAPILSKAEILLHEILEMILFRSGIRLKEPQVVALAYSLIQLLWDNPKVIERILEIGQSRFNNVLGDVPGEKVEK